MLDSSLKDRYLRFTIERSPESASGSSPEVSDAEFRRRARVMLDALSHLRRLEGFLGVCVADETNGVLLVSDQAVDAINLGKIACDTAQLLHASWRAMQETGLTDVVDEVIFEAPNQYHIVRRHPSVPGIFLLVALEKSDDRLSKARATITQTHSELLRSYIR